MEIIVIEENPEWHVSRGLQLLNILEGVPNSISMLESNKYNNRTLYLFNIMKDQVLLDILTRIKPERVNLFTDEIIEELHRTQRITDAMYLRGMNQFRLADSVGYEASKLSLKDTNKAYSLAKYKYDKLKENACI